MNSPIRSHRIACALLALLVALSVGAQQVAAQTSVPRNFWSIDPSPITKIGGADADTSQLVSNVWLVSRTFERHIIVVDDGNARVRIYDSTGKHVATHGRLGSGPGEFDREHLQSRAIAPDTIAVYAAYRGKARYFSIRSGYTTTENFGGFGAPVSADPEADEMILLMDGGGYLLMHSPAIGRDSPRGVVTRPPQRISWRDRGGATRQLGSSPGQESLTLPGVSMAPPFSARTAYAWDPKGQTVCFGDTMNPTVQCFERNGTARTVTWEQRPVPITAQDVAAWRDRLSPRMSAEARNMLGAVRIKPTRPAFSEIFLDNDANLWVDIPLKRIAGQPGKVFSVFARTGRYLGDVTVPPMDVRQIHSDVIIGVTFDADDVGTAVVHRIRK